MSLEQVDKGYREAQYGESYGILNVACATAATKYAITIPAQFKKVFLKSQDGATFTLFKNSTDTAGIIVPANGSLTVDVSGQAGVFGYVTFAVNTKVAEVLYII